MQKCDPKLIKDQVRRTEGQVASLGRMIDEGRDCSEVLQQIVAARASLSKLGTLLLEAEAEGCLGVGEKSSAKVRNLEQVVASLFKLT